MRDGDKDLTWPNVFKYLSQGGLFVVILLCIIVFGGMCWSMWQWDGLGLKHHFYNGWVVSYLINLFAFFLGVPAGFIVFFGITDKARDNLRVVGFAIINIFIVVMIWSYAPKDFIEPNISIWEKVEQYLPLND